MKNELTPIYYDARIGNVSRIKRIMQSIVRGEPTPGVHLEKLKEHNVFSARIDGKGRILFTFAEVNKKRSMVVLAILVNHEYDKTKYLKKGVLKKYLEKIQGDTDALISDEDYEAAVLPEEFRNETAEIDFEAVYENKQHYLILDTDQQAAFVARTPIMLQGPPGSGKTTLGQALIKQALENQAQKVLYVTPSKPLARAVLRELRECQEYDAEKVDVKVYDSLSNQPLEVNGLPIFKSWFATYANKLKLHKEASAEYRANVEAIYEECKIISSFTKEAYTSEAGIGQKQSLVGQTQNKRQALYSIYEAWIAHLAKEHIHLRDFYIFNEQELLQYDLVVADETQYLSPIAMKNLFKMSINSNIVVCSDPRQNPHDEKQRDIHLREMLAESSKRKVSEIKLSAHYRCPKNVMNFAEVFNDLRLESSTKKKSEPKLHESKELGGFVEWYEPSDKQAMLNIAELKNDANTCVITTKAYKQEAQDKFGITEVFARENAIGLERDTVVLYKPLSTPQMKEVNAWLNAKKENPHAKAPNCAAELSASFLAATRSTRRVIVVQNSNEHDLENIIQLLKESIQDQKIDLEADKPVQSTKEEWITRARESFERDELDRSMSILTKHVELTTDEATAMVAQWQQHDVGFSLKTDSKQLKEQPVRPTKKTQASSKDKRKPPSNKAKQQRAAPKVEMVNRGVQNSTNELVQFKELKNLILKLRKTLGSSDYLNKNIIKFIIDNDLPARLFTMPILAEEGELNALYFLSKFSLKMKSKSAFEVVLDRYPGQFKARDFIINDCWNINALWWSTGAAANGNVNCFMKLLTQYRFAVNDFSTQSTNSESLGATVLYWLACGVNQGYLEPMNLLLQQYQNNLNARFFDTIFQGTNVNKGITPLWLIALTAAVDKAVYPILQTLLTLPDLQAVHFTRHPTHHKIDCYGKNVLWSLAAIAMQGHLGLLHVFNCFPGAFNAAQFTITTASFYRETALFSLAAAAKNGFPQCFLKLLEQYPNQFAAKDFTQIIPSGPNKGHSPLSLIMDLAEECSGCSCKDRECLEKLTDQYEELRPLAARYLQSKSILNQFGRMSLNDSTLPPQPESEFEEENSASFKP